MHKYERNIREMIKKTIICDRCGVEITEDHPTKIQVQEYDNSPSVSYGKKAKGYVTHATLHFCKKCDDAFTLFLGEGENGE